MSLNLEKEPSPPQTQQEIKTLTPKLLEIKEEFTRLNAHTYELINNIGDLIFKISGENPALTTKDLNPIPTQGGFIREINEELSHLREHNETLIEIRSSLMRLI